ncbi:MAG: NUDIX domain-containing protein [Bacteroidota bacterium]|nr:NUDIX domain-containing protein [Bacteroidota bacterium]
MNKLSAGLLLYNLSQQPGIKVFLVHPGGPFFKNKDEMVWSLPKGEYVEGEDPLLAAKREFKEETGNDAPEGTYVALQPLRIKSGKVIAAWAIQAEPTIDFVKSNLFEMEWPPKSGRRQEFAEVDKAQWFTLQEAKRKINSGQVAFLEQLEELIRTVH